jgi:hypothetical protein
MPNAFARAHLFTAIASLLLVFALHTPANAQEPALEVFYTKLEPKEPFKYKWKGEEALVTAGVFRWEVPQTQFGTSGLDRNFTGYCAEIRVPITANNLYRFRMNSLYDPKNFEGLAGKENAELAAQKRVVYIKELFGRYFRDPVEKSVNADDAIALQVALWEVIQETEPAEGELKLDLFAGDFQANYPRDEAPAYVRTAQQYLDSLTGNDALYFENPDLRGRELIRLAGIANANKVVAQSQFALRFAGGGGTGIPSAGNVAAALTGGGLVGGVGGPVGVAGLGTGLGAGIFPGGGSSSSPSASTPTVTSPVTTTPPTDTSVGPTPVGGPPTQPPITLPPLGGPTPQTTPVPAPGGLVLGVIALGTLGTWRLRARLLAAKA